MIVMQIAALRINPLEEENLTVGEFKRTTEWLKGFSIQDNLKAVLAPDREAGLDRLRADMGTLPRTCPLKVLQFAIALNPVDSGGRFWAGIGLAESKWYDAEVQS